MKKAVSFVTAATLALALLAGCSSTSSSSPAAGSKPVGTSQPMASSAASSGSFDPSVNITVVSREDGSGTRGAFIELFEIQEKQDDGTTLDHTTLDAVTINSTSIMMTTVEGNPYAIGYISLGSLSSSVKALQIDGVDATAENIISGSYTVSRPFNIATTGSISAPAQDFIDFILSSDGQTVVEENGYIPMDATAAYSGNKPSGKVVVAGSSSVTPVMEKLKEAYLTLNPNAEVEIQQSDSSTGLSATLEGICDIGMASRELKDSELEAGLIPTVIAMDGIAVVVNNENPHSTLSSAQVKSIFTGEATTWDAIV